MLTNNSITTIQDILGLKEVNGLNLIAGRASQSGRGMRPTRL